MKASAAVRTSSAAPYRARAAMIVVEDLSGVPMRIGTTNRSGSEGTAYISVAALSRAPPSLGKRKASRPSGTATSTAMTTADADRYRCVAARSPAHCQL